MTQKVTDEMLMAFVDGETDEATTAMSALALAADAGLAARAERFRASRTMMREAFSSAQHEPVPEALLKAALGAGGTSNVTAFPSRRSLRFALPLAASLALALGVTGYLAGQAGNGAADPLGRNAIAAALGNTKSGESHTVSISGEDTLLRTLATYRVEGGLCRSFELSGEDAALSGVGCDRGTGWNLDLTVARAGGDGVYAPASEAALHSIDAYLDALEASAPLTREEEDTAAGR